MPKAICFQKPIFGSVHQQLTVSSNNCVQDLLDHTCYTWIKQTIIIPPSLINSNYKWCVLGGTHTHYFWWKKTNLTSFIRSKKIKPTLHIEVKQLRLNNVYEGEGHTASMERSDRWWVQCKLAQASHTSKSKDDKPRSEGRTLVYLNLKPL